MKALSNDELRALVRSAVEAGIPICGPTIDELATDFAADSLLAIARRRQFPVWLSRDGDGVEFEVDVPLWFAVALQMYESAVVELMRVGFLGDWRDPR
jgi:hypothetical protein